VFTNKPCALSPVLGTEVQGDEDIDILKKARGPITSEGCSFSLNLAIIVWNAADGLDRIVPLYQAPIDAQTRTDSPISYKDFLRNSPDIL
jgi:hypothetical protein